MIIPMDIFLQNLLQMTFIQLLMRFLPVFITWHFRRQYNRNPFRCQAITVSGFTITSSSRQFLSHFESKIRTALSEYVLPQVELEKWVD